MANPDFIPLDGEPAKSADFIPLEPTGNEKPLQNRPDDTLASGAGKNLATSSIKGLSHIPGAGGDARDMANYVLGRVQGWIQGRPSDQVLKENADKDSDLWRTIDANPVLRTNPLVNLFRLPSGADIARPVLQQTGEYKPTTPEGRLGAAGVETGLAMAGPGGATRGFKAVDEGANALRIAREISKGGAKAVPGGTVAGAIGDEATQVTGDPLAGMAASTLVPTAAAVAKPVIRPLVEPFVPSMRQPAANRILTKSATDPAAALDTLDKRPAKPGETLGEATLDPGILQAEKGALNTSDHFRAALAERDAARAEQRKTAIEGIAPPADQMAPVKLFRQRLEDIDQATQDTVDRATAQAKAAHQAVPDAKPFDATGEVLRNIISEADKAKGAEVSRLYQAIDPDGTLSLVTSGPREAAAAMHKAFDPMVSEPNLATPIIAKMTNLPGVMPFQKLMELDKTITSKMAEAARSGDRVGHGQLVELKGSVQSAIDNAIENQVKWQQGAVARGELAPENTVESKIKSWVSGWAADRDAVANSATGTHRGQSTSSGRPSNIEGGEGVPGAKPNFDDGATERLAAAKAGHAERAQTFRQDPIAPVLKTTGFSGQYAMPAAKVPAAAFPKGDIGYSNARAFLKAAGDNPDALSALQDTAVSRLREAMPEGELTPKALAKWKQDYAPALKAIDERAPGFSDRFADAAKATDALEQATLGRKNAIADAQTGSAAKFLKLTNPSEIGDTLMGMVKAKNGPTQIRDLFDAMWQSPDVAAIDGILGARHALTKTILRDHQNADGMLSGAKLRNFITDNQAALEAAYGKDGAGVLGKLAEDAERYQQAAGIQRSKLGSDSFANFMRWAKEKGGGHAADLSIGIAFANGLAEAVLHGEPGPVMGALALGGAKAALSKLRANGVHKINDLVEMGMTNPEVGKAMMRSALDAKGQFNTEALAALAKSVARASAENETLQEHSRIGRAAGGKVSKVDYATKATQLLRIAEKAKKAHGRSTESLLKYPDQLIAGALRLANQER